jgi:hypothetical protein
MLAEYELLSIYYEEVNRKFLNICPAFYQFRQVHDFITQLVGFIPRVVS